ncbi:hypothetical protein L1049_009717 [Liquidambar formosana]|uniref:Uncharacterized protein n=1 Tax=Liquidambar formosana TaxID=63359 RepID=A0AAP0N9R0_LIQFO
MKGRARTMRRWSTNRDERLYKYLKPGALAQLRDFKITGEVSENAMLNQPNGLPCFALTVNRPRCLHRKKLVAVPPIFVESEPL